MAEEPIHEVRVLDEDPDLGGTLTRERFQQARSVVIATVEAHAPGPWSTGFDVGQPGALGLLVLEGLISVQVTAERRMNLELLGAGDVIRPWAELGPASVPATQDWTVRVPARVAFLDAQFARASLAFPEIIA